MGTTTETDRAEAVRELARARELADAGKLNDAMSIVVECLVKHPGWMGPHLAAGSILWDANNLEEATLHFREVVRKHPTWQVPLLCLVHTLIEQDLVVAAVNELERFFAAEPHATDQVDFLMDELGWELTDSGHLQKVGRLKSPVQG